MRNPCEHNTTEYPREETGLSFHQENASFQHPPQQEEPTVENFKHQVQATMLLDQVLVEGSRGDRIKDFRLDAS